MSKESKTEFLRVLDQAVERIVEARKDSKKIFEQLDMINQHIRTFGFLRIYYKIPEETCAQLLSDLPQLNAEGKRKLLRETLDSLRKD